MKTYNPKMCMVCNTEILAYQVVSGIGVSRNDDGSVKQLYGHYHCVQAELGPERFLKAVQLGLIPVLGDDLFTSDQKLKKYVDLNYERYERPLERVYEFIDS